MYQYPPQTRLMYQHPPQTRTCLRSQGLESTWVFKSPKSKQSGVEYCVNVDTVLNLSPGTVRFFCIQPNKSPKNKVGISLTYISMQMQLMSQHCIYNILEILKMLLLSLYRYHCRQRHPRQFRFQNPVASSYNPC